MQTGKIEGCVTEIPAVPVDPVVDPVTPVDDDDIDDEGEENDGGNTPTRPDGPREHYEIDNDRLSYLAKEYDALSNMLMMKDYSVILAISATTLATVATVLF